MFDSIPLLILLIGSWMFPAPPPPYPLEQGLRSLIRQDSVKGLKDYYEGYFPIGTAVAPNSIQGEEATLILQQFNSLTAENVMKMGPIHPDPDRYFWKDADAIVEFAQTNGLRMRGHALCWHNQTPRWFFTDEQGKPVDKGLLLRRLEEHITAVVSRYKGKIYAWDVVNEAISDDADQFYRTSPFFDIIGAEFIAKAFEFAHQADPEALLFYNDYNTLKPEKRDKIYRMVQQLKENGVPIHGIGMQGHWSIFDPEEDDIRAAIEKYASLGVQIQITELDVSIYPSEKGRREKRPDESDVFTEQAESRQLEQYRMFFKVFRDYRQVITGVTFWNVSDRHSWLDNFPVRGRKNYPLLFDQKLKPKRAFWAVVDF